MPSRAGGSRRRQLEALGDLGAALERLTLPVFLIGRDQNVLWLNAAAKDVAGDVTGRRFTDAVAPESRPAVRDAFTAKVLGAAGATEYEAVLLRRDGSRVRVEINSV